MIIAVGWMCGFEPVKYDLQQTYIAFKSREDTIEKANNKKEYILYTDSITGNSKYNCYSRLGDISLDKNEWRNEGIAKYYGIKFVIDRRIVEIKNENR